MAKSTYLQLCNKVLRETNETTISTVTGNRGLQAYIVDSINTAIFDINSKQSEWPFNRQSGLITLVPGTDEYAITSTYSSVDFESFFLRPTNLVTNGTFTSDISSWTDISTGTGSISAASGRLRLAGGASGIGKATQSLSTIAGLPHRLKFQIFSGPVTTSIGTTSGGTELLTQTCTIDNAGNGTFYVLSFTPTTATTYISFSNSANANYDVDNIECVMDIGTNAKKIELLQFDEWRAIDRQLDFFADTSRMGYPNKVAFTQNKTVVFTPIPKYTNLQVPYEYWDSGTALVADSDTTALYERYEKAITHFVCALVHDFKSDAARASYYERKYKDTISEMKRDLINKNDYMRAV